MNLDNMGRVVKIWPGQSDEDLRHEQNKAYARVVIKEIQGWAMFLSFKISFWGFIIVLSRDPHFGDWLNYAWQFPVALVMIALHTAFPGLVP